MKNFIFLATISGLLTAGFLNAAQGMDKYPYGGSSYGGYGSSYGRSGGQQGVVNPSSSGSKKPSNLTQKEIDLRLQELKLQQETLELRKAQLELEKKQFDPQKWDFPLETTEVSLELADGDFPDLSHLKNLKKAQILQRDLKAGQLKNLGELKITDLRIFDLGDKGEHQATQHIPNTIEKFYAVEWPIDGIQKLIDLPKLEMLFFEGMSKDTQRKLGKIDWQKSKVNHFGTRTHQYCLYKLLEINAPFQEVTCNFYHDDIDFIKKVDPYVGNDWIKKIEKPLFKSLKRLNLTLNNHESNQVEQLKSIHIFWIKEMTELFPNLEKITFLNAELDPKILKSLTSELLEFRTDNPANNWFSFDKK